MAAAADTAGMDTKNLSVTGFKITPDSIENAAILLQEAATDDEDKRNIIIFQIFDNNSYFDVGSNDCKTLPERDWSDNRYHIPGQLELADLQTVKYLVGQAVPLLCASSDHEKVILSPLPPNVKTCCGSKDHLVNRWDPDFKAMLYDGLEDITKSLHDLVGGKKIRNFKVLSPMKLIDAVQDTSEWTRSRKKFWSTDPVHMMPEGYEELAKVVTAEAVGTEYNRVRGSDPAPPNPPKDLQTIGLGVF
jgi:hypothetical protein